MTLSPVPFPWPGEGEVYYERGFAPLDTPSFSQEHIQEGGFAPLLTPSLLCSPSPNQGTYLKRGGFLFSKTLPPKTRVITPESRREASPPPKSFLLKVGWAAQESRREAKPLLKNLFPLSLGRRGGLEGVRSPY